MTESRGGLFGRGKSPLLEIRAKKSDSYEVFVTKAARKCQLSYQQGKALHLFKLSGARVLNESLSVQGKQRPWTIGNYLSVLHKSATNVKIGIGYVDAPDNHHDDLSVTVEEVRILTHLHF